jgi:hypothetical protein
VLSYDLEPPAPAHASECWRAVHTGNRKTEGGGKPFSTGKAVGGPKSYDSTETVVLYIINVNTPFSASVVQWKENFFVRFTRLWKLESSS